MTNSTPDIAYSIKACEQTAGIAVSLLQDVKTSVVRKSKVRGGGLAC
jgi:hypothetical protein